MPRTTRALPRSGAPHLEQLSPAERLRARLLRRTPAPVETPETRVKTAERLHHLDALRGIIMVLGVVLHAALVYSTWGSWVVSDPERSPIFNLIFDGIHAFRMPAFFLLAGFLCVPGLKKGVAPFLRTRNLRLILPLAATALLLNSLQAFLAYGPDRWWSEYSGGRWVSHLWFLLDLIVFTYLAVLVWAVLPRLDRWRPPLLGGAVILVLPLGSAAIRWACDRWLTPGYKIGGFLSLYDLLYYFPFFLYGMLERPSEDPARLRRLAAWSSGLFIVVMLIPKYKLPVPYTDAAIAWSTSVLCLYIGLKCLSRPVRWLRSLADASYTIFLFHQVIVVALALALMHTSLPLAAKFTIVVTLAFALSYAIHRYLVEPIPLLALVFNGRRMKPLSR